MSSEALHANRRRAESFGSVAEEYDRYRPGVPEALVEDLAGLRPGRVLDVACGTGRVAVALTRRGLSVVGVEVDGRMAEVARGHGITVEVSPFEEWDAGGRRFDLITCASAWHWIDPERGADKVAELLRPGGTFARLWVHHRLDDAALAALDEVYRVHAPDHVGRAPGAGRDRSGEDSVSRHAAFGPVEVRRYPFRATLSGEDWARMLATYSSFSLLDPDRLAALQQGVREAIDGLGGTVESHGAGQLLLAPRV